MYVGFSASTATLRSFHYVLGWSFKMNGEAPPLDIPRLPKVPGPKKKSMGMIIGVSLAAAVSVSILIICGIVYKLKRRKKFAEVLEEWERQIGAHRIPYKDLHKATKGFQEAKVIGVGGFGKVYKGILPSSKIEVAVKKVSHDSEEGMRQFLAEITSLGRLRSPNFVELLGYCRRKGELLLVYEFMNNGSLDKLLYDEPSSTLNWSQRFQIIKQIASGLFYLHEKWAQAILHRDIKPGNVLLDDKFNGKLGDFGLSRLYDHGSDPHTTRLVGTVGYMAPELSRTGKATKASDVYAFGVLMLEVVCGRRPMDHRAPLNMIMLVDWVFDCLKEGGLFNVVDPKLGTSFQIEELEEVETVLKLGLLCSHDSAGDRPTIGEVIQFLNQDLPLPEVPVDSLRTGASVPISTPEGSENLLISSPSIGSVSILIGGR
ncbi:L-type lectin-domain containing receptor kinase SIT2-like [Aristolochia californica]|uniref:L-type lectin-domain containing receptor kinase SIT2-like n=1 Tax=Aristolochia californica TaxID=171875 RepID=UPI0035DB8D8B